MQFVYIFNSKDYTVCCCIGLCADSHKMWKPAGLEKGNLKKQEIKRLHVQLGGHSKFKRVYFMDDLSVLVSA